MSPARTSGQGNGTVVSLLIETLPEAGRRTEGHVQRLRLLIQGAVQGVGFRPFLYRKARELGLKGGVRNVVNGVLLEAEGPIDRLESLHHSLRNEGPGSSVLQRVEASWLPAIGASEFRIESSALDGTLQTVLLPDLATCDGCLAEIRDPRGRRYRYPFTTCTQCGPRYSITQALPFDRERTVMSEFPVCKACRAEYEDPDDRRFHAQTLACPVCGPQLTWWDGGGRVNGEREAAMSQAVRALRSGAIIAVQGVGGFHLMARVDDAESLRRLRERKHRSAKPFALMFPNLASLRRACRINPQEEALLQSAAAPIVLLRRRRGEGGDSDIAEAVAPGSPYLGVMLPGTPLHHLLLGELDRPVVATSGNVSEEPLCFEVDEARKRLGAIADGLLVHNRPILRPVDDSVVQVVAGAVMVLRRARGYAPLPVSVAGADPCGFSHGQSSFTPSWKRAMVDPLRDQDCHQGTIEEGALNREGDSDQEESEPPRRELPGSAGQLLRAANAAKDPPLIQITAPISSPKSDPVTLAMGGQDKAAVALEADGRWFVGPHVGDLDGVLARERFERGWREMTRWCRGAPEVLVVDRHPDYASTWMARDMGLPTGQVQHHVAHVFAGMLEERIKPPVLGVAWDGTGLGNDGTIWGGEFFSVTAHDVQRVAHFRTFPLPGGEAAAREPWRSALGLWHELSRERPMEAADLPWAGQCSPTELALLQRMLRAQVHCPRTSSVGRLFDAAASLLGLRQSCSFEGQAAMELEWEGLDGEPDVIYPVPLRQGILDWEEMMKSLVKDREAGLERARLAVRFQASLVRALVEVAHAVGWKRVVLSGGCFQNRWLLEHAATALRAAGFQPSWPRQIPVNDGGLSAGQLLAARFQQCAEQGKATALVGVEKRKEADVSGHSR